MTEEQIDSIIADNLICKEASKVCRGYLKVRFIDRTYGRKTIKDCITKLKEFIKMKTLDKYKSVIYPSSVNANVGDLVVVLTDAYNYSKATF